MYVSGCIDEENMLLIAMQRNLKKDIWLVEWKSSIPDLSACIL